MPIKIDLVTFLLMLVVMIIVVVVVIVMERKRAVKASGKVAYYEQDYLTGLLNREAFDKLIDNFDKLGKNMCVAMVDIDNLRGLNENYGHGIGDQALKKLAGELKRVVRAEDMVIRYDGDEFIIMMLGITISNKAIVTGKIRSIQEIIQHPQDGSPAFSISAGVAFSQEGYSQELFDKAKEALRLTQENGRKGCTVLDY